MTYTMYRVYTLYNMNYTLSNFRQNTRQALNEAEAGQEVLVTRHKTVFKIIVWQREFVTDETSSDIRPDLPAKNEVVLDDGSRAIRIMKAGSPDLTTRPAHPKRPDSHVTVDTCPHGYAKGFCKQDACNRKYAK